MQNIFGITDTITLIEAVELFKQPATYLLDTFFTQKMPVANTSMVGFEIYKGKRQLAPYIVRGSRGIDIAREKVDARFYTSPMIGARRVISIQDIESRIFGEQPIFTTLSPEERAAQLQARDLQELLRRISNTKNKMCAEILTTGKVEVAGFADDGEKIIEDTIDFNWTNARTKTWSNASADIYGDLEDAVNQIAEDTGELPTMLLCGKNIEKYFLNNKAMKDWLMVSNRQNLTLASLQPHYISPQSRYLGTISALGLEIYSYLESYYDDNTKTVKPYIPADMAIVIKPGKGKQLYGAVTLIEEGGASTYSAEYVPVYNNDTKAQVMSLSIYSRFLPVPNDVCDWVSFTVN